MNREKFPDQIELDRPISPVIYKAHHYSDLGQWQDITYYQKYTTTAPLRPERTTSMFGSDRKWRKQMAEYDELEASKIQLSIGMPRDLLDINVLGSLDDQWRGYVTPELYGESISENEFIERIEALATWIDPRVGVDVQQKYQAISELKAKNKITRKEINKKYDQQQAELDKKNGIARDEAEASATDAWDSFNKGIHVTAEGIFESHSISVGRSREKRQLEYQEQELEQSTGLGAFTYSVSTALQRMRDPGQFMADYRDELHAIQQINQVFVNTVAALRDANKALEVIGNDSELIEHKTLCEAEHAAASHHLRVQSIRLCYIAMQYDRGVRTPIPNGAETIPESINDETLKSVVTLIGSAVPSDAPESLVMLANQLISKLYNVPTTHSNELVNQQIAEYFVQATTRATSDMHVDAISRQITERFGDYLTS